jgi:hypothetical protein
VQTGNGAIVWGVVPGGVVEPPSEDELGFEVLQARMIVQAAAPTIVRVTKFFLCIMAKLSPSARKRSDALVLAGP